MRRFFMDERTESRLQFSLQDVFVAILCLIAPMAWIQSLTFAFEDDRGTAYIAMLIGWVCGFLLAINYRRAWNRSCTSLRSFSRAGRWRWHRGRC
jgi:hypothetical protein